VKFKNSGKRFTPLNIMKFAEKNAGNKFVLPKNPHKLEEP